ncbi:uncharacterized protein LOC124436230 [Xenia sp. Carnegie-2017]|uniref:uncharacterized protein LOC124436230 n=1 Tax=Xenia sp. Carnegie-2017 TaxID=2897299 RepID=UPI001F039984|nr:uncharacterized protein LOC124436230 [Xenia sp. Carnegie-2017]
MLIVSLREEHFGVTFPEPCIRLLKALASDKPVCAIVPPVREVKDLLIRIANGANPKDNPLSDLQLLHEQVPLLFCLCNHFAELPNPIRVLCGEMVAKASSPFTDQNGCERLPHNLPQVQCDGQLGFFPSLPSLVERGHYVLDTKRAGHLDDCAKGVRSKKKHGSLIPGIFLILCPHGICYGFQVMPDHESPNVPFTILRTRFSEAPELVIYDNACKLHEYCLNRDPAFFKKSKFIVDKFHWRNHSGCSEGYDINRYPILKTHNSQAAEQCNSVMKPLASMVSYMEYDNFLLFSKLYIWYRNMLRIIKCNPGRDVPERETFLAISNIIR